MGAKREAANPGGEQENRHEGRQGLYYVSVAVLFFSISPILVRWAAESLNAFEIAAGRLLSAGAIVVIVALIRRDLFPRQRDWPRFALFGLIAALHFAFYIGSLAYTTIAHSLAIVYTAPIFIALFSWMFLREGLNRRKWVGVFVAVFGVGILAGFEPAFTRSMLFGDLLAVGSAIAFGLYSVVGRSQRDRYALFAYAGSIYAIAGIWLLPLAAANFTPGGYTPKAVISILALGLLPLAFGHTLYNAALRRANATSVNLIATQEVTGGILLGALLLGEIPSSNSILGAIIALIGIILVIF